MYFSSMKGVHWQKLEKFFLLQTNDKKVTLLEIYRIFDF